MISNLIKTSLRDAASASACFIVRRDIGVFAVFRVIVRVNDLGGLADGQERDAQHLINMADGNELDIRFHRIVDLVEIGHIRLGMITVFMPRM